VNRFNIMIRIAHVSEKQKLEALQWLMNMPL